MKDEISSMDIKIHVIEMNRKISIIDDYRAYRQLKKYIKETKPDIVHLHSSKAGVVGRLAAYKNKIPCVYNAHGWSFAMDVSKVKKNFYAFIERVMAKITYKIINISNFEQELAIRYKITSEERMQVIYNGIDLSKYNEKFNKEKILNELKILTPPFIIGMVARLTKQKSPETFIKVAKEVSREVKNSYFIFVGDGELRDEIEDLVEKAELKDKFLITGWTNEVGKYMSIFDVGVLTSKWEGFGLVLLEYMALGKPVIASKVGGIPDVIQNYNNGILVESEIYKNLLTQLKRLMKMRP
jgi:glycosyltransferase involved in cell wall biosynthesis